MILGNRNYRINPPIFSAKSLSSSLFVGLAMLLVMSSMACSNADSDPVPTDEGVNEDSTSSPVDTLGSDTTSSDSITTTDVAVVTDEGSESGFDQQALLKSLGDNVILPLLQEFQNNAATLHQAATTYATSLSSQDEDIATKLNELRGSWQLTMSVWQEIELLQIGPAGDSSKYTGGEGIRDEIYSWPTVNSCRVDQEIVENVFTGPDFFQTELVNVYGLDALEYLIYNESSDNSCSSLVKINSDGSWDALEATEITSRRSNYAAALTMNIMTHADGLVAIWAETEAAFKSELSNAGQENSIYETKQVALDELFSALFTLDTVVKDKKLAVPAGISDSCGSDICPEDLESEWANYSKENILGNLKGFQKAFLGGAPPDGEWGFDDALIEVGAEDLANQMKTDIQAAIDTVESMSGTLLESLENDPTQIQVLYDAVKKITDQLKGDLPAHLNLKIPQEAAGDSD